MSLADDLKRSREYEMRTYLDSKKAMYENALAQNGETYDIARDSTSDFQNITAAAICADSRIIKILRYAIAPSISQMKFGQFFGLLSIGKFENDRLEPGKTKHNALRKIAPQIAKFAIENLDLNLRYPHELAPSSTGLTSVYLSEIAPQIQDITLQLASGQLEIREHICDAS